MTNTFAPNERARRILTVLLAFALAAAFAVAASIAPAQAADAKFYTATPHTQGAVGSSVEITFTNVSPTDTQDAGSFYLGFPAGFVISNAVITSGTGGETNGGQDWEVLSGKNTLPTNPVIISATSGGQRMPENDFVTVNVTWSAAPSGTQLLDTKGDQQAGGVFKGGNDFKPFDKSAEASDLHPEITTCATSFCLAGEGFELELTCVDADCTAVDESPPFDPKEPFEATVVVDPKTGTLVMVLTTIGKGPAPGNAEIIKDADNDGDFNVDDPNDLTSIDFALPNCGDAGTAPVTSCVHINRVDGNHTEYTVFLTADDPRFRFR